MRLKFEDNMNSDIVIIEQRLTMDDKICRVLEADDQRENNHIRLDKRCRVEKYVGILQHERYLQRVRI